MKHLCRLCAALCISIEHLPEHWLRFIQSFYQGKENSCLYAIMVFLIGTTIPLQAKWLTIHNDFNHFDTDGNPILTRSGDLDKFGDTYYWYGSDIESGFSDQTCYSSTDLLHWKNEGVMITASRGTNRIDVVYNDSTETYVMVMKWETGDWCHLGIATSKKPNGPYEKLYDSLVYGLKTGDISVFKDDDGKAYYLYELNDNRNGSNKFSLGFSRMTSDYLGLEKRMQQWSDGDREASMMMKDHGIYYYLTSKMIYVDPSETQYFTAPSIEGPWTKNLVPIIAPGNTRRDSWSTQCDYVFAFKGTEDTVQMYCGDRWKRLEPARSGDYVWLPITFSPRDSVIIDYYQDWEVEPDRGKWRPIDNERNLALNKTATASSERGSNTADKVTDPSTWRDYLNSKWESEVSDPQWISVDLGSPVEVNRVILKWDSSYAESFKIQLSTDNTTWEDVYGTTKGRPRTVTDETFPATNARYVRMYGTKRGNNGNDGGYSLFDFKVLHDDEPTVNAFKPQQGPHVKKPVLTCKNNTISYRVPSTGFVRIDVVDSRGKEVIVLVDDHKCAGSYETVLPGVLGHGMYIIRLAVGARRFALKKFILW